ncbi:hypothetical protein Tco_1167056 [Tanacetum coccineum]
MVLEGLTGWKLRKRKWTDTTVGLIEDIESAYDNAPNMFSIRIHHGRKFRRYPGKRYFDGHVDIFDMVDIDLFTVVALNMMVVQLSYTEHGVMAIHSYRRLPPRVRATIKDITDEPGSSYDNRGLSDDDIYKDLATVEALNVVTSNNFCNPSTEIDKSKARGLHLQNTPPSENPPTPQTETTNVKITRNLSAVIQNDSTQKAAAKAVKINDKIGKNSEIKVDRDNLQKSNKYRRRKKEQVNKRKRDEKAKKEQVKKKMVKLKRKKKVEDDDKDFVVEEQHDEEDDNKNFKSKFKSLRARTTVLLLYDATQSLSPERKIKIREIGFASIKMEVSLPTGSKIKITPKKIWEVLGIPMGKKKLESDSPRYFNDKFLTAFKTQFEGKNFIWDHIKTSKIGWDDRTLQNWYYGPNTVLMLIYLHYTKCDGMVTITRKWPAIRNWTSKDATDREMFEMSQGKFGLVDVIEEIEETENESEVEKRKLKELIYETIEAKFESVLKEKRELEDMLKENMEMHELFYEDEKFELFVKKFKEEFTTGLNRDENQAGTSGARHGNGNDDVGYAGHCNDEDDVGHANDEDDDEAAEEKEANEATKKKEEAEKLAAANKKEAAEKSAKQAAEKNAKEAKEKAEKEAAEKAEREEIEAAKKNKQAAEKEKKEKAEKEAAEKKKAEMRKAAAEKKEQAEIQAAAEAKLKDKMQKDAEEKKQSPSKKKKNNKSEPTAEKEARGLHLQYTPPSGRNPRQHHKQNNGNVQKNTRILSPVIQNDSTQTPEAKAVKIKDKIGKNSETKVARDNPQKSNKYRRRKKNKSTKGRGMKKQKKEEQVKKKMVKLKGKKAEDDDEDFVVKEQHDEEDDNKNFESKFKSLRARTTLIYLHYTKRDGMVRIPRKWPAIRNWTSKDATDREMFEMSQGKFGLVDVIEEIKETDNESELIYETIEAKFESVLKEKRELEDMLKENMEMHELFYEDEKFELFVKKFKEEFTTGLNIDENQAGTSGARHGNDDDEAAEEKEANEATKKKKEAEKLAAANKKEAAEKSAKQAVEKTTKEAKEKAEKEAAKKAEREKIEAAKKNKQAVEKEKKRKKLKKKPLKRKKLKCGKLQQRRRNKLK